MRHSQNLFLPPRIYPLVNIYMPSTQKIPLPLIIYPILIIYMRHLPNIYLRPRMCPSFETSICDPGRIFPSLTEYTPFPQLFATLQNLPLHPRIYSPFKHLYHIFQNLTSLTENSLILNIYM